MEGGRRPQLLVQDRAVPAGRVHHLELGLVRRAPHARLQPARRAGRRNARTRARRVGERRGRRRLPRAPDPAPARCAASASDRGVGAVRRRDGRQPGRRPAGVRARSGARSGGAGRRTSHEVARHGGRRPVRGDHAGQSCRRVLPGAGLDGDGDHRPPVRRDLWWAACALVPVGVLAVLFPEGGRFPFGVGALAVILAVCVAAWVLLPRSWTAVRIGAALYAAAALLTFAVPNALGANITRLGMFVALPAPRRRAAAASAGCPAGGDGGAGPAVRLVAVVPGHRRHDPQHPRRVDPGVVLRAAAARTFAGPTRRRSASRSRSRSGTTRQCTSLPRCRWLGAGSDSST